MERPYKVQSPKLEIDLNILNELRDLYSKANEANDRYVFTWNGKKKAKFDAATPTTKTFRPVQSESSNFEESSNLFITGDNLEALKILQESYLNEIDVIYIDPPYNTGNNLIYKNNFSKSQWQEMIESGEIDSEGNRLIQNEKSNGRFHSDWLSFIYPRLKIARNLLNEKGFIAVAMDDSEAANTQKLLEEIFGESNYVGTIVTKSNPQGRNKNNIDPIHEYHYIYAKNIQEMNPLEIQNKSSKEYKSLMRTGTNSRKSERPKRFYPMLVKNGKVHIINEEEYSNIYSDKKFNEEYIEKLKEKYIAEGYKVIFPIAKNGEEKVWQRQYDRVKNEYNTYIYENETIKMPHNETRTPQSLWDEKEFSNNSFGTNHVKKLFDNNTYFDYPKSIYTVMQILSLNQKKDSLVLDFFAGSGTTAEAVMQLNKKDGGNRKYIVCTLDEKTFEIDNETNIKKPKKGDTASLAYNHGYYSIDQISRERIRKAAHLIDDESGFRAIKIDSTNVREDIFKTASDTKQVDLFDLIEYQKENRTPYDLLFEVLIDSAYPYNLTIKEETLNNCTIIKYDYDVELSGIICCFEDDINEEIIRNIAKMKPLIAVFKENSFKQSSQKINVLEQFRIISPDTKVKVI